MKVSCFRFTLYCSTVVYIGQLTLNSVLAYKLFYNDGTRTWFLPYIGLLLIPLVLIQLVSAVMYLIQCVDKLSMSSCLMIAMLHVLQLGIIWRHIKLYREIDPKLVIRDSRDFTILQRMHIFTSMIPLLIIQGFLTYHQEMNDILLLFSIAVTLFGICWHLSTENNSIHPLNTRILSVTLCWRLGEIVSRVVTLTVCASVFYYWLFLILGLRVLTMLMCLCTSILGQKSKTKSSRLQKLVWSIIYACMYSICYVGITTATVFEYCLFYIILFFENVVLTVVWYIQTDQSNIYINKLVIAGVSSVFFLISMMSLVIRYKIFQSHHVRENEYDLIAEKHPCINCKLSVCSKHNIKLQRPFSAGWITQYQKATAAGNYYKNMLHDTLLDSDTESVDSILNSSGEHCQIRDTDLESIRTVEKRYTSVQGIGTYSHKRFFDSDPNIKHSADIDSISGGSGIYDDDWRHKPDTLLSQFTSQDTLSLLSSKTKLLTDSWNNMKKEKLSLDKDPKHPRSLDILIPLIKNNLDSSFISEGYTTDNTLESYQLPVTVLAKQRKRLFRRQPKPTYSVTSESTDCTICSFIRNNPSSPESSRRKFSIQYQVPDITYMEINRKTTDRHKYDYRVRSEWPNIGGNLNRDRGIINLNDMYSKPKRKLERNENNKQPKPKINTVSKTPVRTSAILKLNHNTANRSFITASMQSMKGVKNNNNFPNQKPKLPPKSHKPHDLIFLSRVKDSLSLYASDSGDSAFPRNTPLSSYLAATDDDHDGVSESSCEMII